MKFKKPRNLAESGDAEAQYKLGLKRYDSESYQEAAIWWKRAAIQEHSRAQFRLGILYQHGLGVEENLEEAGKWYRMSSALGDREGMNALSRLEFHLGNCRRAIFWAEEGAQLGSPYCQHMLGNMYYQGLCVEQSHKKAFEWFSKSAMQKEVDSQWTLAEMYNNGATGIVDQVKALAWMITAGELGFFQASHDIEIFKSQLSKEQIYAAEETSENYLSLMV